MQNIGLLWSNKMNLTFYQVLNNFPSFINAMNDLNSKIHIAFFFLHASKFDYLEKSSLCRNTYPRIFG
jgi:hypothetical protein